MSGDPAGGPATARRILPRWFFAALAAWLVIAAAALANSTSIPVPSSVVVGLMGVTAIAHGIVWGRWSAAAPLALLAFGGAAVLPALSRQGVVEVVSDSGPADAVGVRVIWVAAALISGLVIAWGVRLHARLPRMMGDGGDAPTHDPDSQQTLHPLVNEVESRVSAIEELLRTVP